MVFTGLLAQQPAAPAQPVAPGDMLLQFAPIIFLVVMVWVLILGPARKQEKLRRAMIMGLKKNDKVVTSGGMLGTVTAIKEKVAGNPGDDDEITLKVDDVKLRFVRSAIVRVTTETGDAPDDKKDDPKK
jgi:preprotein translocase subunit YajC